MHYKVIIPWYGITTSTTHVQLTLYGLVRSYIPATMASLAWYRYGMVPPSTPWHDITINTSYMACLVALLGKLCQHYGTTMVRYHCQHYGMVAQQ